ncbi:hypothetical protein Tco_0567222 [Tanacetum coccineum]
MDMDSLKDDQPIIVEDEEEEDVAANNDAEKSQNHKLEQQKNKAETKVAFLIAQPPYLNVTQLTELLVTSLKLELSHLLSSHNFGSSLPTKLKELPSKFIELTGEVKELKKNVQDLEIEMLGDLKEIPNKLDTFTSTVTKIKTLVALPSLLNKVTEALKKFARVIESALKKARDHDVPSACLAGTYPAIGEKNTKHITISYPPKSSSQPRGKLIEKYKGKEAMSSKDVKRIKEQKRIEESVKAYVAKQEVEARKKEWIDLFGVDVVTKYYKAKLQSDKYCDKMLNRRAQSRIIKCDVLTRKGPITLKVYREDSTDKVIPNFKTSDLHLDEWREVVKACPKRKGIDQDPLDKLNDLERKKMKHADDIPDLFGSITKFKSYVQYGDYLVETVLNESILGPRLDDHARTFSSLLLAEVNKRNLNPLKQMRTIEQQRQ